MARASEAGKSKHRNTDLEVLKAAIRARLETMIRANRTRADFAGKFEALIDSYNAGSRSIEELFAELLAKLEGLLVLDWRKRAGARAQLQLAIQDTLDTGLPRAYTPELYREKCAAVFEHVYERYPELLPKAAPA